MKKFIKPFLAAFLILTAVIMNGCDAFESFQFGLPISFEIEANGITSPSGSTSFCLTDDETYLQYQDDLNSITFAGAFVVTDSVNPATLSGDVRLRLYEGTSSSGQLLFENIANDFTPADHDSTNAYELALTDSEIAAINESLAGGNRCFYGEYLVQNINNVGINNYIRVRIDVLFTVDADL